ncbi:hypothetical protein BN59_00369 [Legionella massiliensis]|uniref:Uncharacterized protein n=1 Tax=Legionella massiliensis TaxID=1034943 RepID=A0A078KP02_9GAMM|nr:hypothetical protein [Legionella massiliensis]CDZ76105.1 hypothetical protein BN59_00369 [Legionella massiliensis]CEE11843.1 hypothetical protein BN1094_00369 [Legionella massiliensis]
MTLAIIKERIFQGIERPAKRFLASNHPDVPMEVEYYAGANYEQFFENFLITTVGDDEERQQVLINELNQGAEKFAQKVISVLYTQWGDNNLPRAIKKIANYSEQYPQVSGLLMGFFKQHVASVDVVDSFGESAFVKILKSNKPQLKSLLFLANQGAKHCTLPSKMQDSLIINNHDIYEQAELNTERWIRSV